MVQDRKRDDMELTHLDADELILILQQLSPEERKLPIRFELGLGGDRVMPYNAHVAFAYKEPNSDGDVAVVKVQ